MRWTIFSVAAFTFLVLELSLSNVLVVRSLGNIAPSFVAVLAVYVSLFAPRMSALWACWLLGLLVDLSIYSPHGAERPGPIIGPNALGYVGACFMLLYVRSMLFRSRVLTIAVMTVLFVAASSLITMALYAVQSWYPGGAFAWAQNGWGGELMRRLGVALYSGVLALLLGRLLLWTTPVWYFRMSLPRHTGRR